MKVYIQKAYPTRPNRSQTGTVGFIYKCIFSCDVSHSTIGNVCTDTQVGIYPFFSISLLDEVNDSLVTQKAR